MTILEIKADLTGIRNALERIASSLERAFPAPVIREVLPLEKDDLITITDHRLWEEEQKDLQKKSS